MFQSCVILLVIIISLGDGTPIMPLRPYDTIVIGLGSAGATAASTLCKAGRRVLALEAQDRVGGRVNTVSFGDGYVELGAEWIHGIKHSRVYDLAIANNVTVLPQDLTFEVLRSDGTLGDKDLVNELVTFALEVVDAPPPQPEPLGQYITRRVKEYLQTKYPKVLEDTDFVEEFLHYMDLLVNNIEASNSWNDVSTDTCYEELEGNQYMSWHRYGYKTFFEILLNTYNNGPGYPNLDIKLNTEVTQIAWPQDPASDVIVTCKDGSTYRAKNVIVTVSVGVLKERHSTLFSPKLPHDKITSIEQISIGVMDKIILSFTEAWWPMDETFFAFIWHGDDRKRVREEDSWITDIYGASRPFGSTTTLTLWTSGECAKMVETLPEDEVKRKTMDLLNRFMGKNITIPEPTAIIRSTWYSNPYTRGSYSYDGLQVTKYPDARAKLGEPLVDSNGRPRVLFAGEATDLRHFSTVHGASDSGYREANRLLTQAKL